MWKENQAISPIFLLISLRIDINIPYLEFILYMYSIVPQNVWVTLSSNIDSLHSPKSVNLTWPKTE